MVTPPGVVDVGKLRAMVVTDRQVKLEGTQFVRLPVPLTAEQTYINTCRSLNVKTQSLMALELLACFQSTNAIRTRLRFRLGSGWPMMACRLVVTITQLIT